MQNYSRKEPHPAEHKFFAKRFAILLVNQCYEDAHRLLTEELWSQITLNDLRNQFDQAFLATPLNPEEVEVIEIRLNFQYPDDIRVSLNKFNSASLRVHVVEDNGKLCIGKFELEVSLSAKFIAQCHLIDLV